MSKEIEKIKARFEKLVIKGEGDACWTWGGYLNKGRYGKIYFRDNLESAHRISYMLDKGLEELPEHCVLHSCDNTQCVRPDHLFAGTQLDNINDMVRKGRHWNTQKVRCKYGHPLSGDNLLVTKTGVRQCRTCIKEKGKQYRYKSKNCANMKLETPLSPCPFCGTVPWVKIRNTADKQFATVRCTGCHVQRVIFGKGEPIESLVKMAVEIWNTRHNGGEPVRLVHANRKRK